MNKVMRVVAFVILGGLVGWLIWLPIYLVNKTPAIEFDGPAGLGMMLAIASGSFTFGTIGIVLAGRKKL